MNLKTKIDSYIKQKIEERIGALSQEVQELSEERELMYKRNREIEVRMHQLVGAIYELQQLVNQDYPQAASPLTQEDQAVKKTLSE